MTVLGSKAGQLQDAQGVTSQNYVVANDEPLNVVAGATPSVTVPLASNVVEAAIGGQTVNEDLKAALDIVNDVTVRGVEGV